MAWKLVLSDVHGRKPDRALYALQVRFVGDSAEIHKTDTTIELVSLNDYRIMTWSRDELWQELRQLGDGKLWFEQRSVS